MKVMCIIFFLALNLEVLSQKRHALYLCLQPNDLGIGLRYDYSYNKTGLYSSLSHGSYTSAYAYIKHHIKLSQGITYSFRKRDLTRDYNFLSAGLSCNIYTGILHSPNFYHKATAPFALEAGAGTVINRFTLAFRYELVKSNVSIDFGMKF